MHSSTGPAHGSSNPWKSWRLASTPTSSRTSRPSTPGPSFACDEPLGAPVLGCPGLPNDPKLPPEADEAPPTTASPPGWLEAGEAVLNAVLGDYLERRGN